MALSPPASRRRSKYWCFTINNATPEDRVQPDYFQYLIMGEEGKGTDTPHIQGYCVFKNRQYLSGAKKVWPRAHLEIRRGTRDEASNYCKKEGDWSEWGEHPIEIVSLINVNRWKEAFDLAMAGNLQEIEKGMLIRYYHAFKRLHQDNPIKPEDLPARHNYWIVAPSGYGKSTYARKRFPDYYDKAPNKWWTGYRGQDNVLLDDFGPREFQYLTYYTKRWTDTFSFPMETKGGGRQIRPKRIIVTSQYTIEECFEDDRVREAINNRFDVVNLTHWKDRINL